MSEDQDWRLRAEFDVDAEPGVLERVVRGVRSPDVVEEVGEVVPHDVAVTHDGHLLFAYAASRAALDAARRAIETVTRHDNLHAKIYVSHWDGRLDEWVQVDPPPTVEQRRVQETIERDAERVETRTMVVTTGKGIRVEVEQTMRDWADKLGLQCELIEHRHLLTTQVAFTVTGPHRKIEEFAAGLRAEELATMRTEREVMLSPL